MEHGSEVTGPITAEQRAAVAAMVGRRELAPRQRERLEMVKAAWLGEDVATIARWSGRTPRTVRRWLRVFRDGGVGALAGAPIPGRPPKADAAYLAALEVAVETAPRTLGLPFDVWTSGRLSTYLEATMGVRDGRAHRPWLAAGAVAPGALRLWSPQTHPGPPPGSG